MADAPDGGEPAVQDRGESMVQKHRDKLQKEKEAALLAALRRALHRGAAGWGPRQLSLPRAQTAGAPAGRRAEAGRRGGRLGAGAHPGPAAAVPDRLRRPAAGAGPGEWPPVSAGPHAGGPGLTDAVRAPGRGAAAAAQQLRQRAERPHAQAVQEQTQVQAQGQGQGEQGQAQEAGQAGAGAPGAPASGAWTLAAALSRWG